MTTWGWFNYFNRQSFDRQQLVNEITDATSVEHKNILKIILKRC